MIPNNMFSDILRKMLRSQPAHAAPRRRADESADVLQHGGQQLRGRGHADGDLPHHAERRSRNAKELVSDL